MVAAGIIGSVTAGVVLGGLLAAAPRRPESRKRQVDEITCGEFLALDPDGQQRIAYWVDGYQVAEGDTVVGTVAFDKFGQPVGALAEECKAAPWDTLRPKLKTHL
jgi:hypothetical protein